MRQLPDEGPRQIRALFRIRPLRIRSSRSATSQLRIPGARQAGQLAIVVDNDDRCGRSFRHHDFTERIIQGDPECFAAFR